MRAIITLVVAALLLKAGIDSVITGEFLVTRGQPTVKYPLELEGLPARIMGILLIALATVGVLTVLRRRALGRNDRESSDKDLS
jgi:hypothetical protein